jgi:hypothetical protein
MAKYASGEAIQVKCEAYSTLNESMTLESGTGPIAFTVYCSIHLLSGDHYSYTPELSLLFPYMGTASIKLTPASVFRHLSSQSGTAPKKCRIKSLYSGTGRVPASLIFFIPVPDWLDAGWSGIPVVRAHIAGLIGPGRPNSVSMRPAMWAQCADKGWPEPSHFVGTGAFSTVICKVGLARNDLFNLLWKWLLTMMSLEVHEKTSTWHHCEDNITRILLSQFCGAASFLCCSVSSCTNFYPTI